MRASKPLSDEDDAAVGFALNRGVDVFAEEGSEESVVMLAQNDRRGAVGAGGVENFAGGIAHAPDDLGFKPGARGSLCSLFDCRLQGGRRLVFRDVARKRQLVLVLRPENPWTDHARGKGIDWQRCDDDDDQAARRRLHITDRAIERSARSVASIEADDGRCSHCREALQNDRSYQRSSGSSAWRDHSCHEPA